jgi:hypothetical protein
MDFSAQFEFVADITALAPPAEVTITVTHVLQTEQQLLRAIYRQMEAPYGGENWDALRDVLADLSWFCEGSVALLHPSLPLRSATEQKIYLRILGEEAMQWQADGVHRLRPVFWVGLKNAVGELTGD